MNRVSESKSIPLGDNCAALLIAATVELLTRIFMTDPPSMPCAASLPTNDLTQPLTVHLHWQMSKALMPQHTTSPGEPLLRRDFDSRLQGINHLFLFLSIPPYMNGSFFPGAKCHWEFWKETPQISLANLGWLWWNKKADGMLRQTEGLRQFPTCHTQGLLGVTH